MKVIRQRRRRTAVPRRSRLMRFPSAIDAQAPRGAAIPTSTGAIIPAGPGRGSRTRLNDGRRLRGPRAGSRRCAASVTARIRARWAGQEPCAPSLPVAVRGGRLGLASALRGRIRRQSRTRWPDHPLVLAEGEGLAVPDPGDVEGLRRVRRDDPVLDLAAVLARGCRAEDEPPAWAC